MATIKGDTLYPWLQHDYQTLVNAYKKQRLSHGLIFVGPQGVGIDNLVAHFFQYLLCQSPSQNALACHQCRSCQLVQEHAHPDVYLLVAEDKSRVIKVDQIRELVSSIGQTAKGHLKIIHIKQSDNLNESAANALLKTLEEPSANTIFILTTTSLGKLKPTILSRCQTFRFTNPSRSELCAWLLQQGIHVEDAELDLLSALSDGSPLSVLSWIKTEQFHAALALVKEFMQFIQTKQQLVKLSEKWAQHDMSFLVNTLNVYFKDLALCDSHRANLSKTERWQITSLPSSWTVSTLFRMMQQLNQVTQMLQEQSGINKQLQIERFLLSCIYPRGT